MKTSLSSEVHHDRSAVNSSLLSIGFLPRTEAPGFHRLEEVQTVFLTAPVDRGEVGVIKKKHLYQPARTSGSATSGAVIILCRTRSTLIRFIFCVCREPTTPKLKISDLGVTCPLRASGAMYAQVPTIFSVTMVVEVPVGEALVNPKSEIFAIRFLSNRIFELKEDKINLL